MDADRLRPSSGRSPPHLAHAAACAQSGAGLSLVADAATPSRIADAVNRLLTETAFGERSAGLADEIAAMPGPDEVAERLERDFAL